MTPPKPGPAPPPDPEGLASLLPLALVVVLASAAIGLTGGAFRLAVGQVTHWILAAYTSAQAVAGWTGFAGVWALSMTLTALPLWGVLRLAPQAAGSGIPRVESLWLGELEPAHNFWLMPVKFLGGVLALASGHALGREGPMVQMGATIGIYLGRTCRLSARDARHLLAASAGAGLAVAFSAPLGGVLFTLEELTRSATARLVIASALACAVAVAVGQLLVGSAPVFQIVVPSVGPQFLPLYAVLGILAGGVGLAYNRLVLVMLREMTAVPPVWRVLGSSLLLALVMWQLPFISGNGETINQLVLDHAFGLGALSLLLLTRFLFGPFSYAVGLPGGLFAPMLAVGALLGAIFAELGMTLWPGLKLPVSAFAVVGMAAFFSATVRAPLTGVVLIIEMTGASNLTLPLLLACLPAALVPFWLGDKSLYEELRERQLQVHRARVAEGLASQGGALGSAGGEGR
ncbi:MAG: ClC family H(+)/Cl(-) exchange transporter [Gammaproteobacteria bacterium]|nr:ClC family H(+)/Cl(-) exchange transporter [Gammaproteobacteria bacterium]